MLPLNRNWYIQRDLCLVHSELATAIEASVVHSHKAVVPQGSESCRLSTHPRLNSQLGKVFLWVTPPEKRESTAKWFFSRMLSNFRQLFLRKFPRYPAVNHSFLEQAALNDLFQQTSGAWISLVEPSGTITRSIFFRTAMCKQCYLKCGSRRSPRLIAINHQPEYHCFRACLKNVGDPGR